MSEILEQHWRVQETADYICSRNFSVVTLQFPDEYLKHATSVCRAVQAACGTRGHAVQAYILADTTYNSLSVDEVAAAHVNAQCVVHYGRASLTKLSRLPAYFVFPQQRLNVQAAASCLAGSSLLAGGSSTSPVLLFLDQALLHQLRELKAALLQLLEQEQGPAAAARLVFPRVPRQHMEPEGRQDVQRVQPPAAAACCGGGTCSSLPPQQQQQQQQGQGVTQQQAEREQGAPQADCRSSGGCRSVVPGIDSEASNIPAASGHPSVFSSSTAGTSDAGSSLTAEGGSCSTSGGSWHRLAGYQWQLPAEVQPQDCGLVWVGAEDAPALLQLQLTYNTCPWAVLDPTLLSSGGAEPSAGPDNSSSGNGTAGASSAPALREGLPLEISRALRRRYFLVEKAREASVVGILVGTLGAAGYADAVQRLRALATAAGKKSYTLLMGKPSPAKLANFPEIEAFVLVADPQGQILDSKEYLAPIITPHEAQLAWAPQNSSEGGRWDERGYRLDFDGVLQQPIPSPAPGISGHKRQEPRFSLLSGSYTGDGGSSSDSDEEGTEQGGGLEPAGAADGGMALALHAQQALQVSAAPTGRSDLVQPKSAADYLLHKRSWKGVEAPLVGAAPKAVEAAIEGRTGRAAGYIDEPGRTAQ